MLSDAVSQVAPAGRHEDVLADVMVNAQADEKEDGNETETRVPVST